jgi:methylglutaconyl-CoA hydratase
MYEFITTQQQDRILYITLNRPEKRNALSGQLVFELKDALLRAEADIHTKVIVLNAQGTVFSAGADLDYLQQLQHNTFEENLADSSSLAELFNIIYKNKKVIIAQVEGHAIAGGCGLATVCDFTFAVPDASFGYTEVKIGFIPAIVSIFLMRKLGEVKAKELLLTGKLISATEAEKIGLINEVVLADQIADKVFILATQLCEQTSAQSLDMTKQLINAVQEMSIEEALRYTAEMNAKARASDDCKKGIASFLSKEKIKW